MKKILIVFFVVFMISIPAWALLPEFGLKVGYDKQNFGYSELTGIVGPFDIRSDPPEDLLSVWWLSVGLVTDLNLPLLPFGLRGEASYAWKSVNDITASNICLAISGKFIFSPPLLPLGFYLGVGPTLNYLKRGAGSENIYGAQVYAGANLKLGLNVFGEVGYGYMFPEEGSWSQINVKFGMYF